MEKFETEIMIKKSSILDFQQSRLCPEIWNDSGILKYEVQEFIQQALISFFSNKDLLKCEEWIDDLMIASSLATYFYKETTDCDVKVIVNLEKFKSLNTLFADEVDESILDWLIHEGRKSYELTQKIPNTEHPLDVYFFGTEILNHLNLNKFDSLYQVSDCRWYKKPQKLVAGLSQSYIINYAKQKAERYIDLITHDVEKTRRDVIDFLILKDYLTSLEDDDLLLLKTEFEAKLTEINNDLEGLIVDRQIIKDLRSTSFDKDQLQSELELLMKSYNYSDGNLIFKYLQRYGYLQILHEIYDRFENQYVKVSDVDKILVLLSGGYVGE
jgi:hypothetical protein